MRSRRTIDMLPLLDVFMVVVFVFATIQEGAAHKLEEQSAERVEKVADAVASAEVERDDARRAANRSRDALALLQKQVASAPAASSAIVAPRVANVLDRLLEKASVVEIEIVGAIGDDGDLTHSCCFRQDPRSTRFVSCGVMPNERANIERWLETDVTGLARALRETRGGAALTLVRQDPVAGFRVNARLGDVIRKLFPDRQVFAEAPRAIVAPCGAQGPE